MRTPSAAQLADIAVEAAAKARELGLEPRVALLSYSNFGNPMGPQAARACARRWRCSTGAASISNMTAR